MKITRHMRSMSLIHSIAYVCMYIIITPRACARGKAIGFVCHRLSSVVIVVSMKIAKSRDLGIGMTLKHNESIEVGEKIASVCFDSFGTAHESHK